MPDSAMLTQDKFQGASLLVPSRCTFFLSSVGGFFHRFTRGRSIMQNLLCQQLLGVPQGTRESSPAGTAGHATKRDGEPRQGRLITGPRQPRQVERKRCEQILVVSAEIRSARKSCSAVPNGTLRFPSLYDPAVPAGLLSIAPAGAR